MGSKTKIVVLHMKEIIYTAVFAALGILLIILLAVMFRPDSGPQDTGADKQYTPGIYTSSLTLNNANLEVEVSVDESHINSIRFSNLDETVAAMFPLIQPAIEDIAEQVLRDPVAGRHLSAGGYSVYLADDTGCDKRAVDKAAVE